MIPVFAPTLFMPKVSAGFPNDARSFNGSTDKIVSSSNFTSGAGYSFAAWINVRGGSGYRCVFRNDDGSSTAGSNQDIGAYIDPSGVFNGLSGTGNVQASTFTPSSSTWAHVGWSQSGSTLTMYGNGSAAGTASFTAPSSLASLLMLGNDAFSQPFNGYIADFAIWNTPLSAGNFATLATPARANTVQFANLVLYYPMIGASPETDEISGNNGTLTGTSVVSGPF